MQKTKLLSSQPFSGEEQNMMSHKNKFRLERATTFQPVDMYPENFDIKLYLKGGWSDLESGVQKMHIVILNNR